MSIEIKRQKLLKKEKDKATRPAPKSKDELAATRVESLEQQTLKREQERQVQLIKLKQLERRALRQKVSISFLCIILAIFILVPKPKLITYTKLNTTATSVFFPYFLSEEGFLLDSNQPASIDEELGIIFLCHLERLEQHCLQYKIIQHEGSIAAIRYWLVNSSLF